MKWLKDLISKYPLPVLCVPTGLSGGTFISNLFAALSDGKIDGSEFHALLSSADLLQSIILVAVIIALRAKDKLK
jgi:hypothetical protein